MDIVIVILEILILLALGCLVLFRKALFSYASEKGKNLATKEDISEITKKIENVRFDYAGQLERSKTHFNAQLKNHGFRYEKEFEILQELTALLVETRDTCLSLRPIMDHVDPNQSEEERKKERLGRFYKARRELYLARETKQPFYPEEIYEAIVSVENATHRESVRYRHRDPFRDDDRYDYWEDAEKRQEEVVNNADTAIKIIRSRVREWELVETSL
ncbi:hypothetical protein [Marinomonas colpomeniae]|uniref:Uncharacterized protein n=1 Tax=Marinomonas colpomeniae TaxID=2774408 RepID=A0ABR8P0N9_9GAMM|nr:hypothetical protein [Marinomonas colpomeniae]MBD5771860.1 hypothetical protein [Marinomonas colpomeniae]